MSRMLILTAVMASLLAARAEEMRIELTPGSYASHIEAVAAEAPESLMLVGSADVRDLRAVAASLPEGVRLLNMQGLVIEEYTYPYNSAEDRGYYPAHTIPAATFAHTRFPEILFPVTLEAIGEGAFAGSALREAGFPTSLRSLGDYAFAGCGSLEKMLFCAPLTYLGAGAFRNCTALVRADLYPTEIKEVPDFLFAGCVSLKEALIPSVAKKIGREVFAGSGLEDVILPYGTDCAPFALAGMKELRGADVNYPAGGYGLLFGTPALERLDNAGAEAPDLMLAASGIADSKVSAGFNAIGDYAFAGLQAGKLVLSRDITRIGRGAFASMPLLRSIDVIPLGAAVPDISEEAIEGLDPSGIVLWVDSVSADAWRAHGVWSRFRIDSSGNSDVGGIVADDSGQIEIKAAGGRIIVSAPDAIRSLAVWSTAGSLLFASAPGKHGVEVDAGQWRGCIVAVEAADAAGRRRQAKLMLD